jgi:cytochrome c556
MRIALFAATAIFLIAAAPPTKQRLLSIMHERHEGMETIGKANKALHRELTAASPNLGVIRASAAKIAMLSQKASGWFPRGTGPELGKTGAKPEIWQNPEDFTAKLRNFQAAAKTFNAAAASGDLNAIKAHAGDLGQACKACHDKYRSEMHH